MGNNVNFNDASQWEEYYYNCGLEFVSKNRDLDDEISICRCVRDNKDYRTKNPPKVKNKIGNNGKISRYSCFNLNYDGVEKNEKAMSFQMIDHPDWKNNWERFKVRYHYFLYLKYYISKIRGKGNGLDQTELDLETDDLDSLVWKEDSSSDSRLEMNVLPSPTEDDGFPERTHVSLFAFTNKELICGKNFGRYEGEIKMALKNVEAIFDAYHNDVTSTWTIE